MTRSGFSPVGLCVTQFFRSDSYLQTRFSFSQSTFSYRRKSLKNFPIAAGFQRSESGVPCPWLLGHPQTRRGETGVCHAAPSLSDHRDPFLESIGLPTAGCWVERGDIHLHQSSKMMCPALAIYVYLYFFPRGGTVPVAGRGTSESRQTGAEWSGTAVSAGGAVPGVFVSSEAAGTVSPALRHRWRNSCGAAQKVTRSASLCMEAGFEMVETHAVRFSRTCLIRASV